MACPKNSRQLPIKIELSNVQQYTRNLSTFMYNFKNTDCRINKAEYNKGCFSIVANNSSATINFSTMGYLRPLENTLCFIKPINEYTDALIKMELLIQFMDKNNKILNMWIPVKTTNDSSKSTGWFEKFVSVLSHERNRVKSSFANDDDPDNDDNEPDFATQDITVNGFNFNDIIPQDSFVIYDATLPFLYREDCNPANMKKNILFSGKSAVTIKRDHYDVLVAIFGKMSDNEFTEDNTIFKYNSTNYERRTINYTKMFYNKQGTKNGPGLYDPDVQPLVCTPVLDENDQPYEGTRLDWVKQSFDGISPEVKNIFFLIIVVILLVITLIQFHQFIFKYIGKVVGDDTMVTRSSSLN